MNEIVADPASMLADLIRQESLAASAWGKLIGYCEARRDAWEALAQRALDLDPANEITPSIRALTDVLMCLIDAEAARHG